jgi:hypothetical protein
LLLRVAGKLVAQDGFQPVAMFFDANQFTVTHHVKAKLVHLALPADALCIALLFGNGIVHGHKGHVVAITGELFRRRHGRMPPRAVINQHVLALCRLTTDHIPRAGGKLCTIEPSGVGHTTSGDDHNIRRSSALTSSGSANVL